METREAKEEIGKAFRMFKAFEKAQEVLATLEQIEQTIAEKIKSLEAITSEVDALQAVKDAALKFRDETRNNAIAEAKITKTASENTAEKFLNDAKNQASSIISAAKSEAAIHLEKANSLRKEYALTESNLADKKAELAAIKQAVADHKAEMKKFVG